GLRAGSLAGVGRAAESMLRGVVVKSAERFCRPATLIASNAHSYHIFFCMLCSQFKDRLCGIDAEMTHRVKDPQNRHTNIAHASHASAFDALKQRLKLLFSPVNHAD